MRIQIVCSATLALAFAALGSAATLPDSGYVPARMVITVRQPQQITPGDVILSEDNTRLRVDNVQPLPPDLSDLQLFIYLDDSTRSSSLGIHLNELKSFVSSLPPTAKVAIGYMRNGTFAMAQPFTTDHQKAAASLRLPESLPGANGSPYFALSDLVKHWPSKEPGRRTVLMLTDGVDRYYDQVEVDDPYVNTAISDSLKNGVEVSTIYLRGSGQFGRGAWTKDMAQSRLTQVTDQTGGYAYFEAFTDPVDIAPFLKDFHERLQDQYLISFEAANRRGVQPVKLHTELPGVKLEGPSMVYVK
jgi:hypothetical protein